MKQPVYILLLLLTFVVSSAGTIALTFAPCYATFCSEDYFEFETRLHLLVYFGLVAGFGCFLLLRSYITWVHALSSYHLMRIPLGGKRVTFGGLLASIWIVAVVASTTLFWLPAQRDFWNFRADPLGWASAKLKLTITGVTGHYADILLGLLVIPVSRNSLLGRGFSLHHSTLLYAHKIIAYLFSVSATAHGVTYLLYATDSSSDGDEAKEEAFATGNPAMTLSESKQRSEWFTMTTYTGIAAILPVWLIIVTSLPWIRRTHYNFFYYTHVIFGLIIFIAACIHASTDFYLLLPGLYLWVADWTCRLFGGQAGGLASKTGATLENAGNNWLRISTHLPVSKNASASTLDLVQEKGETLHEPLSYYYLSIPSISKLQNHAFTAAVSASTGAGPTFLLQPTTGKKQKRLNKEWTWRLGALVPQPFGSTPLEVRVEGPYRVSDDGFKSASHIVCVVGGTGITGALSLASWWLDKRPANSAFTLVWAVRHKEATTITEWAQLQEAASSVPELTVVAHVSSESGRLDPTSCIRGALIAGQHTKMDSAGHAWVYSSGPAGLISTVERSCIEARKGIVAGRGGRSTDSWKVNDLGWYMAKWEV
ncbi:hypothetical protein CLIM01_13250 [Colletotrichum limetticola]|uniref:Ferric oxidoreductase domain-containing protein n=1 Tax=Colletotrichum limetticola TaxID=1209924 RepID=A0ABQ9PCG9_9PEZI|nr:hypothetical protein CLIM01_13250 [Colletotrichum limetticola]